MISKIKNSIGIEIFSKSQRSSVLGGQSCSIKCNSGVWIPGAPNDNQSTQEFACANQGGLQGSTLCVSNK